MRTVLIAFALVGCSVFREVDQDIKNDVSAMKSEFARLYPKEKSQ